MVVNTSLIRTAIGTRLGAPAHLLCIARKCQGDPVSPEDLAVLLTRLQAIGDENTFTVPNRSCAVSFVVHTAISKLAPIDKLVLRQLRG